MIALIGLVRSDDCKIHDLFITLGDFYSSSKDSNSYFIITVTINSLEICNPKVNILNQLDDLKYDTIAEIIPYDQVDYYNSKQDYKRTNHRFRISKSQGGIL